MKLDNACRYFARLGFVFLVLISTVPIVGCTGLKKLQPAFEVNQKNVAEIQANVNGIVSLLELTGHAVIEMQVEARRTAVCANILEALGELGFDPSKVTEQSVEILLHDPNKTAGKRYLDFASAMAASDTQRRKELQVEQPVFAARLSLDVTSQKLANDYVILLNASKSPNISQIRRQVADAYPAIKELIAAREKFDKDVALYRKVVVQNQIGLAMEHADLFNYAAQSNVNVEKAFAAVIGDKGLQTKILGYVTDPKTKSALQDSFDFITGITAQKKQQ